MVKDDIGSDGHRKTEAATYPHEGTSDEHLANLSGQFPGPGKVSQSTNEDEESIEPMLSSPVSVNHPRISQEHYQETSEEQILHSSRDFPGHEHLKSDSEQDNGIRLAIGGRDECELPVSAVAVGEDIPDVNKGGTKELESSCAGTTHAKEDIVVEKFPLRPVAKKFDDLEGRSEEQSQGTRTLEVNGVEQDRVQVLECHSSVVNVEVSADLAGTSLKKKSEPVDKTASRNDGNPSLETSNCSTNKKALVLDISNVAEIGANVSFSVESKSVNDPTGISENLNKINTSISRSRSIPAETTRIKDKLNLEHDSGSRKGSNSTLDRNNHETWERTSDQHAESEINAVLAFFKAFVTAFVKFWTEYDFSVCFYVALDNICRVLSL